MLSVLFCSRKYYCFVLFDNLDFLSFLFSRVSKPGGIRLQNEESNLFNWFSSIFQSFFLSFFRWKNFCPKSKCSLSFITQLTFHNVRFRFQKNRFFNQKSDFGQNKWDSYFLISLIKLSNWRVQWNFSGFWKKLFCILIVLSSAKVKIYFLQKFLEEMTTGIEAPEAIATWTATLWCHVTPSPTTMTAGVAKFREKMGVAVTEPQ